MRGEKGKGAVFVREHDPFDRQRARQYYLAGTRVPDISRQLGIPATTLNRWRVEGGWDNFAPPDPVEIALSRRINILANKNVKSEAEMNELLMLVDKFAGLKSKLAEVNLVEAKTMALRRGLVQPLEHEVKEFKGEPRKRGAKKQNRNEISHITPEILDEVREEIFFSYQKRWYEARYDKKTRRNRFILKSRQIGATYYFAFEALDNAIRTGENQIFLSASRDQAEVFKAYIISFALNHFEVELKGAREIKLSNGAELRFLSTNSNTAQSYHGHLYIDEVFWIPNFKRLKKVASGMAAHKQWTRTYFSTPSAISHDAYEMWSGNEFNKFKIDSKKQEFDISHEALKDGALGPDKIWRHMVTVEDAEAQGCNLFDIAELRLEYNEDDFANLFLCKFIDDSKSVFHLQMLLNCCHEADAWKDYDAKAVQPFANKPVALGYDPSRTRDNASLAILAVPLKQGEAWRVLKTDSYHGQNFKYQANRIKEIKESHNTVHIGIDTTGIGHGVYELVQSFYPMVKPINYTLEMKTQLVLKALDVMQNGRFKFLAGDNEVTRAFMMITQTTTANGHITYQSSRNAEAGHADIAWSIMHALNYEPLDGNARKTTATFSN